MNPIRLDPMQPIAHLVHTQGAIVSMNPIRLDPMQRWVEPPHWQVRGLSESHSFGSNAT